MNDKQRITARNNFLFPGITHVLSGHSSIVYSLVMS